MEKGRKKNYNQRKIPIISHAHLCFFPFFKVGLERTKGLELFNDIMPGKYCTWGSILLPQRGFNSAVRKSLLVCRQSMNRENSVCSLKIVQNIPVFVKNSSSLNRK